MGIAVGALLVTGITAARFLTQGGDRVDPTDAAQVALGKAVYAQHCASCHGANLEGQPDWQSRRPNGKMPAPPHDTTGHTWHHPDEVLFGIIREGIAAFAPPGYESDMPAFGGVLTDGEISAVLTYIKSSWPEDIRRRHAAVAERTKR